MKVGLDMLGRLSVGVVGAVLVVLLLTSCGRDSGSSSVVAGGSKAGAPSSSTVSSYSVGERSFLSAARVRFPGRSDAELFSLGRTACETIDAFGSVELTLLSIAEDPDWSVDEARNAGYLFGLSIPLFCPRFEAEARRLVN